VTTQEILLGLVLALLGMLGGVGYLLWGLVRDAYKRLAETQNMAARWLESSAAQQGVEGPDKEELLGYTPVAGGGYVRDDGAEFDAAGNLVPLIPPEVRADG